MQATVIANQVLDYANGCGEEMSDGQFGNTVNGLREAVSRLNEVSMTSIRFRIPKLKNLTDGRLLSDFLGLGDLMNDLRAHDGCIESAWIDDLLARLAEVEDKLQRLHFKSLGAILALQESIVTKWKGLLPAPANVQPVVSGRKPWH